MQTTTTVGLDIAKSVFQVHCVDADGNVVFCRQRHLRAFMNQIATLPPASSCQRRDVLTRIADHPISRIEDLLPLKSTPLRRKCPLNVDFAGHPLRQVY